MMKALVLSLGLVASLAAPAFAQSVYDGDGPVVTAPQTDGGVAEPGTSGDVNGPAVDDTTTGSIPVMPDPANGDHSDIQRGNQGSVFGANGR